MDINTFYKFMDERRQSILAFKAYEENMKKIKSKVSEAKRDEVVLLREKHIKQRSCRK